MKFKIEKSEIETLAGLAAVAGVWVWVIIPQISTSDWFLSLWPILQYIIFNVGAIAIETLVFGTIYSEAKEHRIDFRAMLRSGFGSWLVTSLILDMVFQPPYFLSYLGIPLIPLNSPALEGVAVDAVFAWLWNLAGIQGPALYIFVYWVTPIIAGFIALVLFKPSILFRMVGIEDVSEDENACEIDFKEVPRVW